MQVGLLSDIHGNLDALRRVWDALARLGLTGGPVLNAGDNVGYGDHPQECIDFLRARPNITNVGGNYDRAVARFPEREAEYRQKWGRTRPDKYAAIKRDSDRLTPDARAWLLALPREQLIEIAGTPVLVTHYAPGVKEGLGPWTSKVRLSHLAAATPAQVIVCGHTHAPFARMAGGTLFVNPGTVGYSYAAVPAYAVLTLNPPASPEATLMQETP